MTTKTAAEKPSVKYPLYKVTRNGECNWLLIISKDVQTALARASAIWTRKKLDAPKTVSIEQTGTVDYIPALKAPHWES